MNLKGPGFWNLPNSLTVGRIALVPVVAWLLRGEPDWAANVLAGTLFVAAMIGDIIDGALARRWNLVSPVGAYLDPMADKLLTATVLVMLVPLGRVGAGLVALLFCRELAITGLRGIASQEGIVLAAEPLGKVKTAYQSVGISMLVIHEDILGFNLHSTGLVLLWIGAFFAVWSAVDYFIKFYRASAELERRRSAT